jgi:hypothetical protein
MAPLRLTSFQVTNFRNIHDSGWVDVGGLAARFALPDRKKRAQYL